MRKAEAELGPSLPVPRTPRLAQKMLRARKGSSAFGANAANPAPCTLMG